MIRRPCIKCGTVDIPKYKRENGNYRRECKRCHYEKMLISRERRREKNAALEKEKARKQMKEWRKNNPDKVAEHNENRRKTIRYE